MKYFNIANIRVGENYSPLIIVELGINHGGRLDKAIHLVDLAIQSGAKVIKHQTHIAEEEMSIEARSIIPASQKKSIHYIIKKNSLSFEQEKKLAKYIRERKKIFISTPFSRAAADRLEKFKVPAFKIGSGECNNYPLVEYICAKKKPIILSTGMNSIDTIRPAVKIIRKYKIPFALMHCTNIYPTPPKLVRLEAMQLLKKKFPDAIIGLSDHTNTIYTSLGAVALGACIIEKHFTEDKLSDGPDMQASMNPQELKNLIEGANTIYISKKGKKKPLKEEKKTIAFAFASIATVKNIKKGEKLTKQNIFPVRPGNGEFKVKDYKKLLGKFANQNIKKGLQIKKNYVK